MKRISVMGYWVLMSLASFIIGGASGYYSAKHDVKLQAEAPHVHTWSKWGEDRGSWQDRHPVFGHSYSIQFKSCSQCGEVQSRKIQ